MEHVRGREASAFDHARAACSLCGGASTAAELAECRWLPAKGLDRLSQGHPGWRGVDGACPACVQQSLLQTLLAERSGLSLRLSEPGWLSRFRIHARQVARYRVDRVFLAGDAAHIHSPFGGQGMNTGMQDAAGSRPRRPLG